MGIGGDFWSVVSSSRFPLAAAEDLEGKAVAVDLSAWLMEAFESRWLVAQHANPHLYLVFTRIVALRKHCRRLVFVVEGRRAHPGKNVGERTQLARWGAEARRLAEALGARCVVAADGVEGEAAAARLTLAGHVDAVVTEDSDALLYGAKVVYRRLKLGALLTSESPYFLATDNRIERVEPAQHEVFGVGDAHRNLVVFALLVGTDVAPGLRGVGRETALNFIKCCQRRGLGGTTAPRDAPPRDALATIEHWRDDDDDNKDDDDADNIDWIHPCEETVFTHCRRSNFPPADLVRSFLNHEDPAMTTTSTTWGALDTTAEDDAAYDKQALFLVNEAHCVYGETKALSFAWMVRTLEAAAAAANRVKSLSKMGGTT